MSVDMCKSVYADSVNVDDELDFAEDEYGYNDDADSAYAIVKRRTEWYDGESGEPWVTLFTTQGDFEMPAGHKVKRKVVE